MKAAVYSDTCMKKPLYLYACIAALLVIVFGTVYAVVQQMQRNDADYPQVQMAEDAASALNAGILPSMLTSGSVQMNVSLAPFVIIYDQNGNPVGGDGYLRGSMPKIPVGVLTAARGHDYHRVTWQPAEGVRIAAVAVVANKYYVVGGRSMTLVERNIQRTFAVTFFGGVASLAILSAMFALYYRPTAHKK